MRLAHVHSVGPLGDGIRVGAMKRLFASEDIEVSDVRLPATRIQVDMLREIARPSGLRHLARKMLDRRHPLLKELHWSIEVRLREQATLRYYDVLAPLMASVDVLQAEGVVEGRACARAAARFGKKFVLDMHGLNVEEAKLTGSAEWLAACTRWEREAVSAATYVVVVTEAMREYIKTVYGRSGDAVILCPNGTELRTEQARFTEPFRVIYSGSLTRFENTMLFPRTAELAASSAVEFVLMGDGEQRNEILDYANERAVEMTYIGRKPPDQVFPILARMQAGFLAQVGGVYTGSPIKVLDYASCGLPVLAGPGAWAEPVRRFGAGLIVDDSSAEQFAAGVQRMRDPAEWQAMSRGGKEMAAAFQWPAMLRPLAECYRQG